MLALGLVLAAALSGTRVQAQASDEAPVEGRDTLSPSHWYLGAYYRHDWIPSYMLGMFFTRAPSVTNDGFGMTLSYRTTGGFTTQVGLGYMPYGFSGAFTADSTLVEDTEWVKSDLALVHLTGSLLWPIKFHKMLALEFGFGLDVGIFTGEVIRDEAYPDANGRFHACRAAHDPVVTGDDLDRNGDPIEYCGQALDANLNPIPSNSAEDKGEQYHVKETRVPAVMAFPMLPHLALRFSPIQQVAVKLEFAFGIAQVWAGASVHVAFDGWPSAAEEEPEVEPDVAPEPVIKIGRVLGKVIDAKTQRPVAGVSIRSVRAPSTLASDENGFFVVNDVPAGAVRFDLSHPEYEPLICRTEIPETGGEVSVNCALTALPNAGAISGQVKNERGAPVAGARIGISGAEVNGELISSREGLFALPDAPAGTYRLRVDAEGYLMQLVELEVTPRETALPEITLIEKPKTSLVKLSASEISIKQQINFETNSAVIGAGNDPLLRQIVDVLLRHDEIGLVEIQGHTDDRGSADHNRELSQARAEAVLEYLVQSGVKTSRLTARGYGPDQPIVKNNTPANRAKNRRVQFIIVK